MNIYAIIDEIMNIKRQKEYYVEKYPDFAKEYPHLLEKLYEENFDLDTLRYMLNQKQKMDANKLTEHEASVRVGTALVDKYVKPNLT
jgi:hypothetical protein